METPNTTPQRKISTIVLAAIVSQRLVAIGYNEADKVCAIQFPDAADGSAKVYQYPMDPEKFEAFKAAESKGKFFGAEILKQTDLHPHTRLTPEEVAEFITLPAPPETGGVNAAKTLGTLQSEAETRQAFSGDERQAA